MERVKELEEEVREIKSQVALLFQNNVINSQDLLGKYDPQKLSAKELLERRKKNMQIALSLVSPYPTRNKP